MAEALTVDRKRRTLACGLSRRRSGDRHVLAGIRAGAAGRHTGRRLVHDPGPRFGLTDKIVFIDAHDQSLLRYILACRLLPADRLHGAVQSKAYEARHHAGDQDNHKFHNLLPETQTFYCIMITASWSSAGIRTARTVPRGPRTGRTVCRRTRAGCR